MNDIIKRFSDIELYQSKHVLLEYLKSLNEEELREIIEYIAVDKIDEKKGKILDEVRTELEYRNLNKYLSPVTSNFISSEYKDLTQIISQKEIADSIDYFESIDIDYNHLIKWCPVMLSIDKVEKIISYLRLHNIKEEEIIKVLGSDSSLLLDILKVVNYENKNDVYLSKEDQEFKDIIKKIADNLIQSKSGTESYKKVVLNSIKENKEVLRKLQ